MKAIKAILFTVVMFIMTSAMPNQEVFNVIESAIASGNATTLSQYLGSSVELELPGESEGMYSKQQAQMILKRFFEKNEEVPKYAITMGVGTIMDAKELLLVASGESKAEAIKESVEGPLTASCPASIIQMHKEAFVIIDKPAASKLKGTYVDTWESIIFE